MTREESVNFLEGISETIEFKLRHAGDDEVIDLMLSPLVAINMVETLKLAVATLNESISKYPYPIGSKAFALYKGGALQGQVMEIKVCGYSESDWHGTRNEGKDRRFVICHNSYNEPYAIQFRDVYKTRYEAEEAAPRAGDI